MEWKFPVRNTLNILVYLASLFFLEISENVIPFVSGNFWKLKLELLLKWKVATPAYYYEISYMNANAAIWPSYCTLSVMSVQCL